MPLLAFWRPFSRISTMRWGHYRWRYCLRCIGLFFKWGIRSFPRIPVGVFRLLVPAYSHIWLNSIARIIVRRCVPLALIRNLFRRSFPPFLGSWVTNMHMPMPPNSTAAPLDGPMTPLERFAHPLKPRTPHATPRPTVFECAVLHYAGNVHVAESATLQAAGPPRHPPPTPPL